MTPEERNRLQARWHAIEIELRALQADHETDREPTVEEARLLEEQDEIEHQLGMADFGDAP